MFVRIAIFEICTAFNYTFVKNISYLYKAICKTTGNYSAKMFIGTMSNRRRFITSVILGMGGFLFAPYGISIPLAEITIDLPWSMVLPILISLAYGWRYGLVAAVSGGALFPFYLWPNNGWACMTTSFIYLVFYTILGTVSRGTPKFGFNPQLVRMSFCLAGGAAILTLYYIVIFNPVLSYNPPFWTDRAITFLPDEVLAGFAFKDSINFIILAFISETLLNLPVVRRWLGLVRNPDMASNDLIFTIAIAGALTVWFVFLGLGYFLFNIEKPFTDGYNLLALLVILTSGFIVARLLIFYHSKQKAMQARIDQSDITHQKMIANIGDVIVIFDKNGINRYKSPNIERWFGWKPQDVVGKPALENVHPDDLVMAQNFIKCLMEASGNTGSIENRYRCKDGTFKWIEFTGINLLHDPDIAGILGNYREITERKEAQNALIEAKERAEESDRLKSAFLQNMSHEIRTPMNAIMGFSELLPMAYNKKEKLEKYSRIINQRCSDLLDIINDLLNFSKIESGKLSLNNQPCNLRELFAELSSFFWEYQNRIDKKHISFALKTEGLEDNAIIVTDKIKLKQIFINLINNAFKFTHSGNIEGGCRYDENHQLIFYVSDTGIGIPADKHKAIFDRFVQIGHNNEYIYGGTGLGLSIVKGLIDMMGGTIWLESEQGKGTSFFFTLPIQQVSED